MRLKKCMLLGFMMALPWFAFDDTHADTADINTLVSGVRALGYEIPEFAQISASCDGDAMCAARFLKDSVGTGAQIVPATQSQPKRTGWRDRKAPMRIVPDPSSGAITIQFVQFDAAFLSNFLSRLAVVPQKMILDLRQLALTDELGEVRRTASLFTGKRDRAFRLTHSTGREVDWQIPQAKTAWPDEEIIIQIGAETPGNGLAFAAILKRYVGAKIKGGALPEQLFVHQIVPITHGWEMHVPSGRVTFPY